MTRALPIPTVLVALLLALVLGNTTHAQTANRPRARQCDGNVCVFLSDGSAANTLHVVVEGPPDAQWLGIGFASSMASGDSYIGMVDGDKKPIVSRRRLVGRRAPQVLPAADQHATTSGSVFGKVDATNKFVVQFSRPKTGVDIARPVTVIFAYSTSPVTNPGPTAAIPVHERYGQLTLDLNSARHQADHDAGIAASRDAIAKSRNGGGNAGANNNGGGAADPSPSPTAPENPPDAEQGKGLLIPGASATPGAAGAGTRAVSVSSAVVGVAVASAAFAWLLT